MPGHSVNAKQTKKAIKHIKKLDQLIQEHDVIYLLTDSRESRWLPSMLSTYHNKICINSALGFDSFVVMRHGPSPNSSCNYNEPKNNNLSTYLDNYHSSHRVGCYFCNDVVAPRDSLANRTLDQQCTVTRPGVSYIAGALAVEIMVSLLNHPLGLYAPPPNYNMSFNNNNNNDDDDDLGVESIFGIIPHQIRGHLSNFNNSVILGHAYEKCTACSKIIIDEYHERKEEFVLKACNEPKYLEDLSGLTKMKEEADNAFEAVDFWSDEDFENENSLDDF
eukprot:TRINITY_DN956_c2_g2_i1.p2 TRINITY_DN956_c2_g2~~TRINITY_DN956_c2_g2_i1.p2  ORF type:complete len:277 (-),score=117.38 TRINITY_DN956_c2_g2_i1:94-924(-)